MKIHYLIFATLLSCSTKQTDTDIFASEFRQAETKVDSSFAKLKVDNITTCYTTLTDLKQLDIDFEEIEKDKLDSLVLGYSHQSDNYFTNQNRGLLIGTYDNTELINTFWLTKEFKGVLTDKYIDSKNYTVSQMVKDFPEPRFRWSITGVSPYWIYTNDTINFFIKVDNSISRFPLDENYYQSHTMTGIQLELSCWKIYGPTYAMGDTVLIKPLYSPLTETHTNYFLLQRQPGIETTLKEIFSAGKKTIMLEKKIGLWTEYTSDHKIKSKEWYKNGKLIRVE
jgi:hypothetical protein